MSKHLIILNKKIRRGLPLVLTLLFLEVAISLQAQEFYIDSVLFKGRKVVDISENRGAALILTGDNSLFLMNKNREFKDVTLQFDSDVINDITCLEIVNEDMFYVGTSHYSVFLFDTDSIVNLRDVNPPLPEKINAVNYLGSSLEEKVMIGTNDGLFVSEDFTNFTSKGFFFSSANSITFFESREVIYFDARTFCSTSVVPGSNGILYETPIDVSYATVLKNEDFNHQRINDVKTLNVWGRGGAFGRMGFFATDRGLHAQYIYGCSDYALSQLDGFEIYDLENLSNALSMPTILLAGDSGLYKYERFDHQWEVLEPVYERVLDIDTAYKVNYSPYHNIILVGSDDGLVIVKNEELDAGISCPEITPVDTIDFCIDNGWIISKTGLDDRMDIQWLYNGVPMEKAVSSVMVVDQPGLYSVVVDENKCSSDTIDVSYLRADTPFTQYITMDRDAICFSIDGFPVPVTLKINNAQDGISKEYEWHSLERGYEPDEGNIMEFRTSEPGHYFVKMKNCNGFEAISDTVFVFKTELDQLHFDSSINHETLCEGDTLFVQGAETASQISWNFGDGSIENFNQNFIVLSSAMSEKRVVVRATDGFCSARLDVFLPIVLSPIEVMEWEYTICDSLDYVFISRSTGVEVTWEGSNRPVSAGVYPITFSNGTCPDVSGEIMVTEYDPMDRPILDVQRKRGDTLVIPIVDASAVDWTGAFNLSDNGKSLYITSVIPGLRGGSVFYNAGSCTRSYNFSVYFTFLEPQSIPVNGLAIFPNPARRGSQITLDYGSSSVSDLAIVGVNGQNFDFEVQMVEDGIISIQLNELILEGIYILKVTRVDGVEQVRRLVVN